MKLKEVKYRMFFLLFYIKSIFIKKEKKDEQEQDFIYPH